MQVDANVKEGNFFKSTSKISTQGICEKLDYMQRNVFTCIVVFLCLEENYWTSVVIYL